MKVIAPNRSYSGVSAGVEFKDGIGQVSDPYLISWFSQCGYAVISDSIPEQEPAKPVRKRK